MNQAPFECPQCGDTDIVEISDGVVTKCHYGWNAETGKFVFRFEDSENFGNTDLQCGNCHHSFDAEQYDQFVEFVIHPKEIVTP